ncbi:MAG: type II secretion system F family protein [Desulfarculus sp.]|nr:type II secretion system F family protein [Desulfarculus sp.]
MAGVITSDAAAAPWGLAILAGLAVLSLAAWLGLALRGDPASRRIERLLPGRRDARPGLLPSLREALFSLLGRLASPARPNQEWQESGLRRELTQAGHRTPAAMTVFLGSRVVAALALPGLALLSPLPSLVRFNLLPLALAGAAVLGYLIPGIVLSYQVRFRRDRIGRELPDVLDLLVISVEAGLGLDAAIKRVAQEVRISAPTLAGELHHVSLELKAGIQRAQALRNLADRCGVDEVSSLVTMMVQADRFGVSVGRSLRVHSDSVRTKRRQRMEERAAKIPLKLLFPVLFMIFPAIMAVMAGPALIRVSESIIK